MLLTSSGCSTTADKVDPEVAAQIAKVMLPAIPDIPADLRADCETPRLGIGFDSKSLDDLYEVALRDCNLKRSRAVAWSDTIRRDYSPQGAKSGEGAAPDE
jgi:hypothetical protein